MWLSLWCQWSWPHETARGCYGYSDTSETLLHNLTPLSFWSCKTLCTRGQKMKNGNNSRQLVVQRNHRVSLFVMWEITLEFSRIADYSFKCVFCDPEMITIMKPLLLCTHRKNREAQSSACSVCSQGLSPPPQTSLWPWQTHILPLATKLLTKYAILFRCIPRVW